MLGVAELVDVGEWEVCLFGGFDAVGEERRVDEEEGRFDCLQLVSNFVGGISWVGAGEHAARSCGCKVRYRNVEVVGCIDHDGSLFWDVEVIEAQGEAFHPREHLSWRERV